MDVKLQCTDTVSDTFYGIALAMSKVIHRIDAPFGTGTVMRSVVDTVDYRISEKHVRMRHVYLSTQNLFTFLELSVSHCAEQFQVFLRAAVSPRRRSSGFLNRAAVEADLLQGLVIYISQVLLNQKFSPIIQLLEVIRSITFLCPLEAKPADVLLYGIYILNILFCRVGVVETEVGLAPVFLSNSKVQADTLCMPYMKITVRLRRKTGEYALVFSGSEIFLYDFFYEVEVFGLLSSGVEIFVFHNARLFFQTANILISARENILNLCDMIKSMTGYGKGECTLSDHSKITVEIKSLNGKNADISIKGSFLPKEKELEIRKLLATELVRGSIDFAIGQEMKGGVLKKQINTQAVKAFMKQTEGLIASDNISQSIILSAILRIPDVIETQEQEISDSDWAKIDRAIAQAIKKLNAYRTAEGKALEKDVLQRVGNILAYLEEVKKLDVKRVPAIKERLRQKIGNAAEANPERLEQELVFYVEKLDINEEKVRLAQHCSYFTSTLRKEPLAGKKLGFIVQEMGREINTLGSKANDALIQALVVKMKDELEKIREQSLNIL